MGVLDFFNSTIGFDAGSSRLRILKEGEIIFDEPSEISFDTADNKATRVGNMVKNDESNKVLRPVNYVIGDFHAFESLLRDSIRQADNKKTWLPLSYKMYFSIPYCATEVEKRAYRDSAEHAGAIEVMMVHSPCTAALGMNILFEMKNFLLVDFSASKIEITIFSNSIPVGEGVLRLGSNRIEYSICNYIKRQFGISITQEEVRTAINSYGSGKETISIQYKEISVANIEHVIDNYLSIFDDELLSCLDKLDDENKNKILANGIFFTGGGSNYSSLCSRIAKAVNLNYEISQTPSLDNINGLKSIIDDPKRFRMYLMQ